MALLRFIVDIESGEGGDVTKKDFDDMGEKLEKYAESVLGVQYLGNKLGDDNQVTYHVHRSDESHSCQDCVNAAQDERR